MQRACAKVTLVCTIQSISHHPQPAIVTGCRTYAVAYVMQGCRSRGRLQRTPFGVFPSSRHQILQEEPGCGHAHPYMNEEVWGSCQIGGEAGTMEESAGDGGLHDG